MSETIYALTILYCVYVVDEAEGDKIVKFGKDFLHIDVTKAHNMYRNNRDKLLHAIKSRTAGAA